MATANGNYNPAVQQKSQVAGSQLQTGMVPTAGTDPRGQSQAVAGSPVTPTGQISQTPAPQAPAPAPAPPAPVGTVHPGATTDPFAASGGGVQLASGAWVPKNHPLAASAPVNQAKGGQQAAPMSPYGNYPATYQWNGSPVMDLTQNAVMGALQSPMYGPDQINAMKGIQKDQSALMEKQLQQQAGQDAASRGTYGSGNMVANDRKIGTGMASDLLGAYRNIDLQTNDANRQDLYNAINAGEGFTGMNEGLNQQAVNSALSSFFQSRGMDINSQLGNRGIDAQLTGDKYNLAGDLIGGLLGYQSNLNGVGLGYAQLDAQQQNALLNRLLGMGGA